MLWLSCFQSSSRLCFVDTNDSAAAHCLWNNERGWHNNNNNDNDDDDDHDECGCTDDLKGPLIMNMLHVRTRYGSKTHCGLVALVRKVEAPPTVRQQTCVEVNSSHAGNQFSYRITPTRLCRLRLKTESSLKTYPSYQWPTSNFSPLYIVPCLWSRPCVHDHAQLKNPANTGVFSTVCMSYSW